MKKYLMIALMLAMTTMPALAGDKENVDVHVVQVKHAFMANYMETLLLDTQINNQNVELKCETLPLRTKWHCMGPAQGSYTGRKDGKHVVLEIPDESGHMHDVTYKVVGGW